MGGALAPGELRQEVNECATGKIHVAPQGRLIPAVGKEHARILSDSRER